MSEDSWSNGDGWTSAEFQEPKVTDRSNVAQHVVPEFYLRLFADHSGKVIVRDVSTGRVYAGSANKMGVENEAFTLVEDGERNHAYDDINTKVEGIVAPVLKELDTLPDPFSTEEQQRVFTHLWAFTSNLIARSRGLRDSFNTALARATEVVRTAPAEPEGFDEQYRQFLANPEAYPKILERSPGFRRVASLLREFNSNREPAGTLESVHALERVQETNYAMLLGVRMEFAASRIHENGLRADILVASGCRFITSDDPIVFEANGERLNPKRGLSPTFWTELDAGVFLPLTPRNAVRWSSAGTFQRVELTQDAVQSYNAKTCTNAIRQVFACDRADFPG